MDTFMKILLVCIAIFFIWQMSRAVKQKPELLSRENLSKSFSTMGLLILGLIGFVYLLVVVASQ